MQSLTAFATKVAASSSLSRLYMVLRALLVVLVFALLSGEATSATSTATSAAPLRSLATLLLLYALEFIIIFSSGLGSEFTCLIRMLYLVRLGCMDLDRLFDLLDFLRQVLVQLRVILILLG